MLVGQLAPHTASNSIHQSAEGSAGKWMDVHGVGSTERQCKKPRCQQHHPSVCLGPYLHAGSGLNMGTATGRLHSATFCHQWHILGCSEACRGVMGISSYWSMNGVSTATACSVTGREG